MLERQTEAPYSKIDVLGKTADEVAQEIITKLGADFTGGVLVLVGLSGTGKGTTVVGCTAALGLIDLDELCYLS